MGVFRKLLILAVAGFGVSSQLAFASSDTGTLLVGATSGGVCLQIISGYDSPISVGSYSPTGLTGGKTVTLIIDSAFFEPQSGCPANFSGINVSGFSSNPGQSWLTSVTCNGVTNTGSSAGYSYSGGLASWSFSKLFGFTGGSGHNFSCTIVHD